MRIKYFFEYMVYNKDDSPLYLFESSFDNHPKLSQLLNDYSIPKYFKEDFFELVKFNLFLGWTRQKTTSSMVFNWSGEIRNRSTYRPSWH